MTGTRRIEGMDGDAHPVVAHQKAPPEAHGQRGPAQRQAGRAGALGGDVQVGLVGGPGVAGPGQQLPGRDVGPGPHPERAAPEVGQHDVGLGPAQGASTGVSKMK